jgi:hypothetical protein
MNLTLAEKILLSHASDAHSTADIAAMERGKRCVFKAHH